MSPAFVALAASILIGGCRGGFEALDSDAAPLVGDGSAIDGEINPCLAADFPTDAELRFHFRFDAPIQAAQALDESGIAATCNITDCPSFRDGVLGPGSFHFDSDAMQYLRVSGAGVDLSAGFSLSLWVRLDSLTSQGRGLLAKTRGTPDLLDNTFFLGVENTLVRFDGDDSTSTRRQLSATGLATDWRHVATTFDGASGRKSISIDGVELAVDTVPDMPFNDRDLLIGADEDDLDVGDFFRGDLDDVRVYGRVLSRKEIAALAACRN